MDKIFDLFKYGLITLFTAPFWIIYYIYNLIGGLVFNIDIWRRNIMKIQIANIRQQYLMALVEVEEENNKIATLNRSGICFATAYVS